MINTLHGPRDESELTKIEGSFTNATEYGSFVEYWDGEELVHRSVDMTTRTGLFAAGAATLPGE